MTSKTEDAMRRLYLRYGCCMASIVVEKDGDEGIGSAFHVGDGVFVTARHVVEGTEIKEIRLTDWNLYYQSDLYPKGKNGSYTVTHASPRMCDHLDGVLTVSSAPVFHPDPDVDVAAIRVKGMAANAHFVPLGGHLDDWVGPGQFELSRALILGYPPVPFTNGPVLISVTAEVNAIVDLRTPKGSQMHFILSAIPRGGFSGGLAFSEWGFALGVVTQSLLSNQGPPELGFFTTTSIEAVYECLARNACLPDCQKQGWDGLWD